MRVLSRFYEGYHKSVKPQKRVVDNKSFTYRHIVDVLDKFDDTNNILDVGSGVGTIDFYLASRGKDVTGIEISKKAIKTANASAEVLGLDKHVIFEQLDFLKDTIKGNFDLIICSEVLEHLNDNELPLRKIYNISSKGTLILITVPSKNAPLERYGLAKGFDKRSGHLRRYTMDEITSLIQKNKFEVIYKKKTESLIRNSLYVFRIGRHIIRIANKYSFVSDLLTMLDDKTLRIFGESQLIVVARK